MSSLAEFAAAAPPTKKGPKCWACGIPEADEIASGKRAGIGPSRIRAWLLKERGYSPDVATAAKVAQHLREHVR